MIIAGPDIFDKHFVVSSCDSMTKEEYVAGKKHIAAPIYFTKLVSAHILDTQVWVEDDRGNLHSISMMRYLQDKEFIDSLPRTVFP